LATANVLDYPMAAVEVRDWPALGPLVSAVDSDSPAVEHWNDIYTLLQTNSSYSPGSISE